MAKTLGNLIYGNRDGRPSNWPTTAAEQEKVGIRSKVEGNPDYAIKRDNPSNAYEQEISGIRVQSKIDLTNPMIFGTDTIRIGQQTTDTVETMYAARGSELTGGLVGKGIAAITGGKLNSIPDVRNKVNDFLGIPKPWIPTRVAEYIKGGGTMESLEARRNGTEFGKFLQQNAKGKPETIIKQSIGGAIRLGKDKLRTTLFGAANKALPNYGNSSFKGIYTQDLTYSKRLEEEIRYKDDLGGDVDKFNKQTQAKFVNASKVINLENVSPVYGVTRGDNLWFTELGERIKKDLPAGSSALTPYSPLEPYTGVKGDNNEKLKNSLEVRYGISNERDIINESSPASSDSPETSVLEEYDLIPFWIGRVNQKPKTHFRSILSGISETVTPQWTNSQFFGNPFNFYTYSSIERSVTFTLKVYCSNEYELGRMWEKINELTRYTYPEIANSMVNPPIIDFRLGDIYNGKVGIIESLSYTIDDESGWETDPLVGLLPKLVEISMTIKFIEQAGDNLNTLYGYELSDAAKKTTDENSGATTFSGDPQKYLVGKAGMPKQRQIADVKIKGLSGDKFTAPKDLLNGVKPPLSSQSKIGKK